MATSPLIISAMTLFPSSTFTGNELLPLVSNLSGANLNYRLTTRQLALLIPALAYEPTILIDEATYASVDTDTRILVDNTGALTTTITLLSASSYALPILVKDIGGFASQANPITINFTGGETVDGLTSIDITNPYGWFTFNPLAAGNFYAT